MLALTPASFVFLYSLSGIDVVPAVSVVAADRCNPHEFYCRSVSRFYESHFESFIGDFRISARTAEDLEAIRMSMDTRRLLHLGARDE
jgi:hypothetical protein